MRLVQVQDSKLEALDKATLGFVILATAMKVIPETESSASTTALVKNS